MSMWLHEHPKKRRTIILFVLIVFVVQFGFTPQPAYAILGMGDIVFDPAGWLQTALNWIRDNAYKLYERGLKVAAWKAFQTALQRFLGRIAYETAVWIGSGDKGKKPLLYTKGWKQYLEDAGDAAAGDFIETLADEWSGQSERKKEAIELEKDLAYQDALFKNRECSQYGPGSPEFEQPRTATSGLTLPDTPDDVPDNFSTSCAAIAAERARVQKALSDINTAIARTAPFLAAICTPPDGIQLNIALGLGTPTSPKAPKCTFSQMRDNWEKAVEDPAFLDKFSLSFNPSQSDLGIALDLQSNLLIEQDKKRINETLTRSADGAFKSVTSGVSGAIQTPARMIDKQMERTIDDAYAPSKEQPPPGLLEGVATIFTNTLVSSLGDRLKKGFWSLREVSEKKKSPNLGGLGGRGGTAEVEKVFQSLKEVQLQPNSNFDIVTQFQQCPAELKQQMNIYACVLDPNFADAIRGGARGPMTVREAMDEGLLHGEWNFGYDDPAQGREPAFNAGYAYSSMVKLRRFRILPVGWEFAAQYIKTRNQSYKLEDVVHCYEDPKKPDDPKLPAECQEPVGGKNPFWHLVDPNWVLKAPSINCRAWGAGQQVYKDTGQRLEYCADVRDCVVENENGTCAAEWYCTREKNIWRFAGNKCDAQYDTCLAVDKEDTDEELSALQNSWDRAGCDVQTSGCAAHAERTYDTTKKEWVNAMVSGVVREERFLTKQAVTCSERAVGCRAFIRPTDGVNLVPNGTFEQGVEGQLPIGWGPQGSTAFTKSLPMAQRGQSATLAKDFAGLLKAANQQATVETSILGVLPERTYTVSAWAYVTKAPTPGGNISVRATYKQGTIASALLNIKKLNEWQEVGPFGALTGSGDVLDPKILLVADAGAEVFWDDVSVHEGAAGGTRSYGEGGTTYLRWTDETKQILSCTKDEVGCALYTPENGDHARAGVLSTQDFCPRECVGYARFTEQAPKNLFDVQRDVSMIPSTAQTCRAEEVGCDEFTNLDEVAKGGEGLTYFTEIRQCQKPVAGSDCAPFYTYEGSATSGAQLQTYSLKAGATGDPATTDGSGDCVRILDPKDSRYNPNCRDFINAQGKHSFRDITKTITCSNSCYPFRKTNSNQQQCAATGGEWGGNACTYDVIPSEGKLCAKQARGCRAYIGNTGHVLKTVAREDFERGKPKAWETDGVTQTEAPQPGGHSLALDSAQSATWTLDSATLNNGAHYTISFLAKKKDPAQSMTLTLRADGATPSQSFTQSMTASGWHDYTVGSITGAQNKLVFSGSASFYIDDVLVRRTNDQYYRIKDSWNTPSVCTASTIGCQAYRNAKNELLTFNTMSKSCAFEKVGCAAYIDTQNSTSPFAEEWNVGGDKQCVGGTNPGTVCNGPANCTGGGVCRDRDEVKTKEDQLAYLINRSDYACNADERGCAAFETQAIGKKGKIEATTAFFRDDPDLYGSALCSTKAEGCATYNGEGGSYYFHDPKDNVCEYRKIPGSRDFGWFKKGSSALQSDCPKTRWAKLCPAQQSGCTKFIDPLDTTKLYPEGYNYFAIKDDNLDTGSCGTAVDRRRGCVLLQDTSNAQSTYAASSTTDGSDTPVSQCVNPKGDRVIPLNIASKPNEHLLEFSGTQKIATGTQRIDRGSYMVEFEAKPRRIIGQFGSAPVRVELEGAAPGTGQMPGSGTTTTTPTILSVNLVANGSFERGVEGQLPDDWRENSADIFTKVRMPTPHTSLASPNDFAGRLEAGTQQGKVKTFVQTMTVQQPYTVRTWAYVQTAPAAGGVVEAQLIHEQGGRPVLLQRAQFDTTKINQWQEIQFNVTLTSPWAQYMVRPELIVDPGGIVFFDDVSVAISNQAPGGGTTGGGSTVQPGGIGIQVGSATVVAGGWNKYRVGPVKIDRANDVTGRVIFTVTSDVVMIENVTLVLACDANVIMKVTRDRSCGEWLYCKSSVYQFDTTNGEYREVCTELGRCREANPDRPTECKTPIPTTFTTEKPLTRELYQGDASHVGWAGLDYTGYSIPNVYPVESLRQITRSPTKLTYIEEQRSNGKPVSCDSEQDCRDAKAGDLCLNNKCYVDRGIDGKASAASRKERECRLYPDATSPIPSAFGDWGGSSRNIPPSNSPHYNVWEREGGPKGLTDYYTYLSGKKSGFKYSELCQEDANNDGKINQDDAEGCDCSYKKVLYANGEYRYYAEEANTPAKLFEFETDPDPLSHSSQTYKKKTEDTHRGWRGYCIESDPNPKATRYGTAEGRPCFTWWPVDTLRGEIGLFANHPEAGYSVGSEGGYYCLRSELREHREEYDGGESDNWFDSWINPAAVLMRTVVAVGQALTGGGDPWSGHREYTEKRSNSGRCDGDYELYLRDTDDHFLYTTYEWGCRPIGGPGWYVYDGDLAPGERTEHVCTRVAQVATDAKESNPFTSRIVNNPKNFTPDYSINPLQYTNATTHTIPYGQIAYGTAPSLWGDAPLVIADKGTGGRPYACFSPSDYGGACIGGPDTQDTSKLPRAETESWMQALEKGKDRLQEIFATSYHTWWAPLSGVAEIRCRGICSTARPQGCYIHDDCKAFDGTKAAGASTKTWNGKTYTCATNTCITGPRKGEACTTDCRRVSDGAIDPSLCASGYCGNGSTSDTLYKPCAASAACTVTRQDPAIRDGACSPTTTCTVARLPDGSCPVGKEQVINICQGGPRSGTRCSGPLDCTVETANTDAQCSTVVADTKAACRHTIQRGDLSGTPCDPSQPLQCVSDWNQVRCRALATKAYYDIPQGNIATGTWKGYAAWYEDFNNTPCTSAVFQQSQPVLKPQASTSAYALNDGANLLWDITSTGEPPAIAAVITNTSGQVTEGQRGKITINGDVDKDLIGENGTLHASLRFYAYNENGDQMPLRKVTVKWGNGDETPIKGLMQNHKNVCRRDGAFVCAGGAVCQKTDPSKPCEHKDIRFNPVWLTSTACPIDKVTNSIREGTECEAYLEGRAQMNKGICYKIEETTKHAVNFGDSRDACIQDEGVDVPGYFNFEYDYVCSERNGCTYNKGSVSVTVEDNWARKTTATYQGKITINPAPTSP